MLLPRLEVAEPRYYFSPHAHGSGNNLPDPLRHRVPITVT